MTTLQLPRERLRQLFDLRNRGGFSGKYEGDPYPAFHELRARGPVVEGVPHVLERPIHADVALVYAARGDELGNLWYRRTARNFNPPMATAGKVTVAEVEALVDVGKLDPNFIHTPGIYVQRVIQGAHYEKRIERRTVRP